VFLANLGALSAFKARANFAANFLAAAGIGTSGEEGFEDVPAAAKAFQESGATVACICSTDQLYEALAAPCAAELKKAGARHILIAGQPDNAEAQLRQSGVDDFIYKGCNMIAALNAVADELAKSP
jgi:methylmalonyl-CoA mutase